MTVTDQRLPDLLGKQRKYLEHFFENFDFARAQKIVDSCLSCEGLIVITGIGKSGIIAEKIAMTLVSTGTRALFIPAQNLLHGDIGVITKGDLVILLSKSGETEELLELIPHLRKKQSQIVSVVSSDESRLARNADLSICLPLEKELCPFDLAPTTSTTVQLLFGDLLSVALMQEKGFSLEEYAHNHPSGAIGQKITKTASDLMKKGASLPLCKPTDLLMNCLVELSNKQCGCLLVVNEEQELLGIFTDGDLRRALQEEGKTVLEKTMNLLMTENPICVQPEDLIHKVLKSMQSRRYVMAAPVIENKKAVGLIRLHDIIHQGM